MSVATSRFPELGFYLLPGHTESPRDLASEAIEGERLGFGAAFISERFDVKEIGVMVGAASAVTSTMSIATAATNVNTRHPITLAALAASACRMSEGRFALGLARGVGIRASMWGLTEVDDAMLADAASLLRSLLRGERVFGHEGALGSYPYLHLADFVDEAPPLLFVGFGPKSIGFAGSVFDGVVLHTFLTDDALRRSVASVRGGAERAGRDPASVKVWSVLAVDHAQTEESRLRKLVARLATYLQAPAYGELLVKVNEWDPKVLESFRDHDLVAGRMNGIDSTASLDDLRSIAEAIPSEWMVAASGDAATCAERLADQFRAGADGVILHGSTSFELAPVLEAYAAIRDSAKFASRTNRIA